MSHHSTGQCTHSGTSQCLPGSFPEGTTVIGPNSAASAVTTDPTVKSRLTLHPDWTSGNMLLYAINGGLIYVIPYYGTSSSLTVPVMVAVVNGYTKQVGSYAIT